MVRLIWKSQFLFVVLGCAIGCGSDKITKGTVEGTVKLDGQPLGNVEVHFGPDASKNPLPTFSVGSTDANGHYQLVCSDGLPGAAVGWHNVTITDRPAPAAAGKGTFRRRDPRRISTDEEKFEAAQAAEQNSPTPKAPLEKAVARVPARYIQDATSSLKYEVKPGKNVIDLELSSK